MAPDNPKAARLIPISGPVDAGPALTRRGEEEPGAAWPPAGPRRKSLARARQKGSALKKDRVWFGCEGHDEVFGIDVVVADRPRRGDAPRLSQEQYARYLELEASHAGTVPLTPEEFDALEAGDPERVAALASEPGSNLNPLLRWAQGDLTA
ncbi:MAG: hypothetical protein U0797_23165 [Gemmataceae bacterium]